MQLERLLIIFILVSCNSPSKDNTEVSDKNADAPVLNSSKIGNMTYKEQLIASKKHYPFENWRESYNNGLKQYTEENCNRTQVVFDTLIAKLIALGQNATEKDKVELFKIAVLSLNKLNDEIEGLIETGEREDLCELIDQITIATGMDPKNYANGDGIADEWRDW